MPSQTTHHAREKTKSALNGFRKNRKEVNENKKKTQI